MQWDGMLYACDAMWLVVRSCYVIRNGCLCDVENWKTMSCKLGRSNVTVLRLRTSKNYPVLQSITPYHKATPYYKVQIITLLLRSTRHYTSYYNVRLGTTKCHSVQLRTIKYYSVLQIRPGFNVCPPLQRH